MADLTTIQILQWLDEVKDPEIPVLSLVDLGVITDVKISGDTVQIEMTPTFVGCPALDLMKTEIAEALYNKGVSQVDIEITFRKHWTSDMISEKGKQALKKFGLAPPPVSSLIEDLNVLEYATCPRCESTNTELKNMFGPTLCRSIHYCNSCRETFEQFKPL